MVWVGLADRIEFADGETLAPTDRGACEDAGVVGKRILVRRTLPLPLELDTFLHEHLHAGLPDISEAVIESLGGDLARALLHHYRIQRGAR